MEKTQTLANFYQKHFELVPENILQELGHFNVFKLENLKDSKTKCSSYGRKEFYKISLMSGRNIYHYADQSIAIEKNALVFTNPTVPYHWEHLTEDQHGYFCLFTEDFFHKSSVTPLQNYPMFTPGGQSVFLLSDEQNDIIENIFKKMLREIDSDYLFKFDVLRNSTYDLIHETLKSQPAISLSAHPSAFDRITSLFIELLERQFPIESTSQRLELRSAADFSKQLRVHVNHLNKALKAITGKTTSTLITDRIVQEARILLKHTQWTVSEIAYCLGFEELSHFINFFKKYTQTTPKKFREAS